MISDQAVSGSENADISENSDDSDNSAAQYHTVKKGDTLSKLARRYHTTVKKLCSLNGIKTTTKLKIGKRLRVR